VIAAGGTGGHIFPGLAVAAALRRLVPDVVVSFLGTPRGLEQRLVPAAGHRLHLVDMVPFAGRDRLAFPAALVRAAWQARAVLRREGADVAVGMGGYASAPLVAGARLTGIPSVVHESGAIPGKANLLAARLTPHVAVAFPRARGSFGGRPVRVVGMPLSPELAHLDRAAQRGEARATLGVPAGAALLLVSGGSQGAASLDRAAVELAGRWRHRHDRRILLKPGRGDLDAVRGRLAETGGDAVCQVVPFIDRMDHAYAAADVAVCRAGAGTVAELAVAGLPSVLVPYPHATADHQARNAADLVEAGGAVLLRDHEATGGRLGPLLDDLLGDPARLAAMGAAARRVGRPHAAEDLAGWVLELATRGAGRPAPSRGLGSPGGRR
jgi:UDP-N-acetylglucosamine--N-acetylmuramyl-(pentapeptide) pyrophosphoryl-undecaprenol N-acetylglucosamine transferase